MAKKGAKFGRDHSQNQGHIVYITIFQLPSTKEELFGFNVPCACVFAEL